METIDIQGGPKSKPLQTYQISYSSYESLPMRLDLFVKLKYKSNTKILSVGIKYFVLDLLFDANNYA